MRYLLLSLPFVLAACAGPDTVPMSSNKAQDFSNVDVEGIAKCVRANATDAEALLLDQGGELAQSATRTILSRPETGDCIVAASADANLERVN